MSPRKRKSRESSSLESTPAPIVADGAVDETVLTADDAQPVDLVAATAPVVSIEPDESTLPNWDQADAVSPEAINETLAANELPSPEPTPEELEAAAAEAERVAAELAEAERVAAEAAAVEAAAEAERQAVLEAERQAHQAIIDNCKAAITHYLGLIPYADLPDLVEWMGRMKNISEETVMAALNSLYQAGQIRSEQAEILVPGEVVAEKLKADLTDKERAALDELLASAPPDPLTPADDVPMVTKSVTRVRRAA